MHISSRRPCLGICLFERLCRYICVFCMLNVVHDIEPVLSSSKVRNCPILHDLAGNVQVTI